jgi:hypothetical protein
MVRRVQRDALVTLRERDRAKDLQVLARRREPLHARFLDQVDEWRGAAIHDRDFRGVQLDDGVVDAEADQCGQQVLHGVHRAGVAGEAGGIVHPGQVLHGGRNLHVGEIRAAETNPEIRGRGPEGERDLVTGVKADTRAGNRSPKCPLCDHQASGRRGDCGGWGDKSKRSAELII